jgi:putative ABC transport system ATP-binding protein
MDSLISVRDITKHYDLAEGESQQVLRGVNLDIGEGEFVAIMGRSGSGKSTFMNIIGLLDIPSSGEYYLQGRPVSSLSEGELARLRNHTIGFVFQSFNLISRRSVLDNVMMPLLYAGTPVRHRREMARSYIEMVGLAGLEDRLPNQLSGGQQQRVAIARAMIGNPRIILADEPTGNLDSTSAADVMRLLATVNESRITILMVTHEYKMTDYASRVIHFNDGHALDDHL